MSPHTRCVIEGIDTNTVICTLPVGQWQLMLLNSSYCTQQILMVSSSPTLLAMKLSYVNRIIVSLAIPSLAILPQRASHCMTILGLLKKKKSSYNATRSRDASMASQHGYPDDALCLWLPCMSPHLLHCGKVRAAEVTTLIKLMHEGAF